MIGRGKNSISEYVYSERVAINPFASLFMYSSGKRATHFAASSVGSSISSVNFKL